MNDTRRAFLKQGLLGLGQALLGCWGLHAETGFPPGLRGVDYPDKLRGMVLLGAYGDALGAWHEGSALGGALAPPERARRLPVASAYQPPGQEAGAWWVWFEGGLIPAGMRGVPTDDTSFRVMVLQPWLCSLPPAPVPPTEAQFEQWVTAQQSLPPSEVAPPWHRPRAAQMADWLVMWADARRWQQVRAAGPEADPAAFVPAPGNPFFRAGIPVVFGMFMYLELAALYTAWGGAAVMRHFATYSLLDQGYSGLMTGLFAGLVAEAMQHPHPADNFSDWYARQVLRLLDVEVGTPADRSRVRDTFTSLWERGVALRGQPEVEFLVQVKAHAYEAPLLPPLERYGLDNFDPLLFFRQITITLAYADGDVQQALRLLASGPGDADTVPSVLGTVAGAWAGEATLRARDAGLSEDLDHVRHVLTTLYAIDFDVRIECLVERMAG